MPFKHPDLIGLAKEEYFGMRDAVPGRKRRKYGWADIARAVGRSPAGVRCWFGGAPVFDEHHQHYNASVERIYRPMPRFISAWMQLIEDTHPHYALQKRYETPRPSMRMPGGWPNITETVSWEQVEAVLLDHEIGVLEAEAAFWFPEDRTVYYTVRTLGNDGVSWMLLQLMCDCHPDWRVVAREEIALSTQEAIDKALDYSELLKEIE